MSDEHKERIQALREHSQAQAQSNYKREKAVAKEIATIRAKHNRKEQVRYLHMFVEYPQRTDMSFWVTRVGGDPPKRGGVPEAQKGVRPKTIRNDTFHVNSFRWRALQHFKYWPNTDPRPKHLSR